MKWVWIIVILVIVLAGTAFWLFGRSSPLTPAFACATEARKPVIVAYGDSLVAGYGAPEQQGFVGPLSDKIGTTIINEGVSGDTTADALKRLPDVLAQKPDIVIVLLGGNDALQQVPLETTKQNIAAILSTLTENHIHIVLVGVLGGILSDPYAPMFKELSSTYATEYVPNILNGLLGNSEYMYDQVHPNAAGYTIAASKIYPALNTSCSTFEKQ